MRWRRPGSSRPEDAGLPEEDTWFRDGAKEDASFREAFLAWMIEGCIAWQRDGLGEIPPDVKASKAGYMDSSDALSAWLTECGFTFEKGCFTLSSELYLSYSTWAKFNGNQPPAKDVFLKRFLERFPQLEPDRRNVGRGVVGIKKGISPAITGFGFPDPSEGVPSWLI